MNRRDGHTAKRLNSCENLLAKLDEAGTILRSGELFQIGSRDKDRGFGTHEDDAAQ